MHSVTYQRLAEKSMNKTGVTNRLKEDGANSEGRLPVGQTTTGRWRATAALSSRMPGSRAGSLYHTYPFSFLRSCRSLPPSFDWKGSRKTQTRKEWQFEKLDSFSNIQPICKSTDFPVRDLIFLSTVNEGPAPVSAYENRRGHEEPADKVITFLIP